MRSGWRAREGGARAARAESVEALWPACAVLLFGREPERRGAEDEDGARGEEGEEGEAVAAAVGAEAEVAGCDGVAEGEDAEGGRGGGGKGGGAGGQEGEGGGYDCEEA